MTKQTFTTGQVLTAAQMTSLQQTAMGGGSTTAKTASYVLVAADAGTVVQMNSASATTITVNTALFAAGDSVQIQNVGAGVCTVTAGTATVSTSATLALKQYDAGTLYFNTTSAAFFFAVDAADTPLTTTGDIIYSSSGSTAARLGIGSSAQVLTVASGIPSWATPAAGGGMTLLATTTLTGSSVTVSSLSTYKQIYFVIRNARIVANGNFNCTFNSDTGSKYTWNGLKAHDGNLSSATGAAASTSMRLGFIGDSATTTNLFNGQINVAAADQTSGVSVRSTGGFNDGTGTTAVFFNGQYFNTAVISSATINAGASTWAEGTLMTYGVN